MRRESLVPFFIAVAIGVACALPSLIGYVKLGWSYQPFSGQFFSSIPTDEVTAYVPGAAYVKEKLLVPGDIDIYEHRHTPVVRYVLPSLIQGGLGRLSGSMEAAWLLVKLIFPALVFLLAYAIARKLARDKLPAILAALLFCTLGFGPQTFVGIMGPQALQPVLLSRVSAPAAVLPFLLVALLGLVSIQEGKMAKGVLLAGISGGLLFYSYYYYQIAFGLMLVGMAVVFLFTRRFRHFGAVVGAGLLANAVALPWYMNLAETLRNPGPFARDWLPQNTLPSVPFAVMGLASAAIVIAAQEFTRRARKDDRSFPERPEFPLVSLTIVAVAAELILPAFAPIIQPGHFQQQIVNSWVVFLAALAAGAWLCARTNEKRAKWHFHACSLALLVILFAKQSNAGFHALEYSRVSPAERSAEMMIREFSGQEDVIAVQDPYWNSVLPARIWRYRFYAFFGLTAVSAQENIERYLAVQKLFGRPWDDVAPELAAAPDTAGPPMKMITVPYILSFADKLSPAEIERYRAVYASIDPGFFKQKRLDYVIAIGDEQIVGLEKSAASLGLGLQLVRREGETIMYRPLFP